MTILMHTMNAEKHACIIFIIIMIIISVHQSSPAIHRPPFIIIVHLSSCGITIVAILAQGSRHSVLVFTQPLSFA